MRLKQAINFGATLAWLGVAAVPVSAQTLYFTNTVPTNWTAVAGSLIISTNHYKTPTNLPPQCLQWNYATNDILTVTNPGINSTLVQDYYNNTCDFWVYNPSPLPGKKLTVQFVTSFGAVPYYFDFYLNYSGWRRAVRSFRYDMFGPANNSTFAKVNIIGPTNTAGQLFIDEVTWVGPRFTRNKDFQNVDVDGTGSDTNWFHCYYEMTPDIPTNSPTPSELSDLAAARANWLADNAGSAPTSSSLNSAYTAWTNLDIVVNGTNVMGEAITLFGWADKYYSWISTIAQDVYWKTNAASSNKLNLFLQNWWDQGNDMNSGGMENPGPYFYNFRTVPKAFVLGYKGYGAGVRQHAWQMVQWMYRIGGFWSTNWLPGLSAGGTDDDVSTDDIYTGTRQELGAILFLTPDDATAVQYLKGYKRYLERFLIPTYGTTDALKVDGCGFHHWGHYNHYMYVWEEMEDVLYDLRGTQFQINSNAYRYLRAAELMRIRTANGSDAAHIAQVGYNATSLSGRSPFQNSDVTTTTNRLQRLGLIGGDILGVGTADPMVAQVYNKLFGTTAPYAAFTPFGSETNSEGFYQFNYSPIGILRQSNWVATIHGMNNDFWGTEISTTANLYGRYQSYGACEILYPGGIAASGWSLTGWDWNKPPGATTILLPWTKLLADSASSSAMERDISALNFAGALAFHSGGNNIQNGITGGFGGIYACNFQVYTNSAMTNHDGSFVWRKSWFCFTNQIICLASDIKNNDAANPTITTLFQGVLTNTTKATVVNGTNLTGFPYNQTNSLTSATWLLDGYGTGYFIRPGASLALARTLQTSPDNTGTGTFSSTNYATAWLHHGAAPTGAGFEYVVAPGTTTAGMNQLSNTYASPVTCPYAVLQRDTTAHVVQWKPDGRIGYAIFQTNQLTLNVTTSAPIQKVSLPLLALTQSTSNALWLTVVNPDLNLINNVSTPTNVTVTVAGNWAIASGPTNATILSQTSSNTTVQVTTVDGLPVEMLLSPPPDAPQTLSAVAVSGSQINLNWSASSNATSYLLQRNGVLFTNVTGTNFGDTGLLAGTTYTYLVLATNSVGVSPPGPTASATTFVTGSSLVWDANIASGGQQDGSGIWNTTATNWLFGGSNIPWFDHNTANFGINTTTNCIVTLASDVTPSNIVFNTTGGGSYTIAGSNYISTTDGLNINARQSAVVTAPLAGTGGVTITNTSSASLTLSGTNIYIGMTLVNAGTVNVSGDQTAALGGWMLTSSIPSISVTVNFNSSSAVASTNAITLRNTMGSGFANATLNVSGTVTNSGTLNVNRLGVLNLNSGANWQQTGSLSIAPGGNTAGTSAMTVSNGATFTYFGVNPISLSPASVNVGYARLTIVGGTFITSQSFANSTPGSLTNATITLTNGGLLVLSANIPQLLSGTPTNTFLATGNGTIGGAIDTSVYSTSISNVITGSGSLAKLGSGTLTLSASNTFAGPLAISNGTLLVNGYIGTGAVTVAFGSTLGGTGTVGGAVNLNGTIAPGSGSVGILNTAGETWNSGGAYQFSLNNATNSAGWDLLNITGSLNLQSATNNPFTIRLVSLTSSNTLGPIVGFDSAGSNSWTLASVSAGIQNFNAAKFVVDTSAFSNEFTGTFTVSTNAGSLRLNYAGVGTAPPQILTSSIVSNNWFQFSFTGPNGQSYRVLATTNLALPLANWTVLSSNLFGAGAVNYVDLISTNSQKFFRVGSP